MNTETNIKMYRLNGSSARTSCATLSIDTGNQ